MLTVPLQPGVTVAIPGPQNDGADFFGLGFALIGIVLAIVVVRLVSRGWGGPPQSEDRPPTGT